MSHLHAGSLVAWNSTSVPSISRQESQVINMKNDGDMTRFEDVSIRHVASDTNKFEETVSVVCRSVLTFNPFFPFAVFIENFFFSPQKPSSRL